MGKPPIPDSIWYISKTFLIFILNSRRNPAKDETSPYIDSCAYTKHITWIPKGNQVRKI